MYILEVSYSELLKNSHIVNQDFRITINDAKKGDLIYVDPPYVTKSNESSFDMYSADQFNWNSQKELAHILDKKNQEGVNIIVSNINDKNVASLYLKKNGWLIIENHFDQSPKIKQMFFENGFTSVEVFEDFSGIGRFTFGRYK